MNAILKNFLILWSGLTLAYAEEAPDEIKKIDERLEELKTIWRQEQAIINGFTKNRTVPVREGSKEYHACLKASQRIQQAEAEAKTLKERKATLASGKDAASKETPQGGAANSSTPELKLRNFDFEGTKAKSEPKKGTTLVFKGFYLGMPGGDAIGLLNHYMKRPQVTSDPTPPAKADLFTRDGKGPHYIVKRDKDLIIAKVDFPEQPFALLDAQGNVIEFRVTKEVRDILFDSKDTPLKEFMQTFIDQYKVPELEANSEEIKFIDNVVGRQDFYTHRSPKGFELKFFGNMTSFDEKLMQISILGAGNHVGEGGFSIKAIQTEEDRSSKFD